MIVTARHPSKIAREKSLATREANGTLRRSETMTKQPYSVLLASVDDVGGSYYSVQQAANPVEAVELAQREYYGENYDPADAPEFADFCADAHPMLVIAGAHDDLTPTESELDAVLDRIDEKLAKLRPE
jgi:hypothetical protein